MLYLQTHNQGWYENFSLLTIWDGKTLSENCTLVLSCFVNKKSYVCCFSFLYRSRYKGLRGVSAHEKTTTEGRPARGPK